MKLAPGRYWITRDSEIDGTLGESCDLWSARPQRCESGDGALWLSGEFDIETRVGTVNVEVVRRVFGTAPDTDRECIRFER